MKQLELRLESRFLLQRKLGGGGCGAVYQALDEKTGNEVAMKLEALKVYPSLLDEEAETYKALAKGVGIPKMYWTGTECDYRAIALELLGPSLEDLLSYCDGTFSLKTVLMLADQFIRRLQYMHSKNIIHGDVKPDNFLMGTGRQGNCVYISDLGLSSAFLPDYHGLDSRPNRIHLRGTDRYASIRGHYGTRQSMRDDMESLAYVLLFFLKGRLPWQGTNISDDAERNDVILTMKENMSVEELCEGVPQEFASLVSHVRDLKYADKPRYSDLCKMFSNLFRREGYEYDNVYDWTIKRYEELSDEESE